MALEITNSFIKQYESDVHMAYQRMGSKLRNTVRVKNGIKGSSTTFQKVGTGSAVQKTRHAELTQMSITHTPVECTLGDWYASDYIDKLDELKINIDERMVAAESAAAALGRKTDEMIITAMDTTTNVQTEASTNRLTTTKINKEFARFGNSDIPDDGNRFWTVSADQWTDLLAIAAFSSSDYVNDAQLPYAAGMAAKRWMTFMWFTHSGLPVASNIRKTFAYHRNSVGHAIGADVTSEINYVPTRVAHLATSMMSMGSVLIDATGVGEVQAYAA